MSGKAGSETRTGTVAVLGTLAAIEWLATHRNESGKTDAETFATIASMARRALDRAPLP